MCAMRGFLQEGKQLKRIIIEKLLKYVHIMPPQFFNDLGADNEAGKGKGEWRM